MIDCRCTKYSGRGPVYSRYGGDYQSDSANTRIHRVCGYDDSSSKYGHFLEFGGVRIQGHSLGDEIGEVDKHRK
jgi:hypothetical protein